MIHNFDEPLFLIKCENNHTNQVPDNNCLVIKKSKLIKKFGYFDSYFRFNDKKQKILENLFLIILPKYEFLILIKCTQILSKDGPIIEDFIDHEENIITYLIK